MDGYLVRVDGSHEPTATTRGLRRLQKAGKPTVEAFCPHCPRGPVLAQLYRDADGAMVNFVHVSAIPPGVAGALVHDVAHVSVGDVKTCAAPYTKQAELWEMWRSEAAPITDVRCYRCLAVSTIHPETLLTTTKRKIPA